MNKCPKCNKEINELSIDQNVKDIGTFTMEEYGPNFDWDDQEPSGEVNYRCPECNELLFTDDEEAEEFLTINK